MSFSNVPKDPAEEILYTPTAPLTTENVQEALDEVAGIISSGIPPTSKVVNYAALPAPGSVPAGTTKYVQNQTGVYLLGTRKLRGWYESDGAAWKYAGDNSRVSADSIYDNATSGLTANNVQAAIDEVEARVDANDAKVSADGSVATHSDVTLAGSGAIITVAERADLHTHTNKAQLDLVTDGDHDVRTDNPHSVTAAQAGADPTGTAAGLVGTHETDLASNANLLGASLVGIEDAAGNFVGTTVEAALAEAKAVPYVAITAAGPTVTTSPTYVVLTGITTTPPAGTYVAMFSTTVFNTNNNRQMTFGIHVAGTLQATTQRTVSNSSASETNSINCLGMVTVNGAQAVDVRWFCSGNTATADRQTLILTKVA